MPIMSSASITVVGPSRTSSLLSPSACLFIHSLSGPSSCGGRLGPLRHRADNLSFYAIAHIFLEKPGEQYCVWAYNASCTTGGMAGMPDLLGLHSPLMGVVAVLLSFGLSAALIAACVSLFLDARRQSQDRERARNRRLVHS
jgi:hypothetical protein